MRYSERRTYRTKKEKRKPRFTVCERKYAERLGCNSSSHHRNNSGTILVFFSAKENERTMKKIETEHRLDDREREKRHY